MCVHVCVCACVCVRVCVHVWLKFERAFSTRSSLALKVLISSVKRVRSSARNVCLHAAQNAFVAISATKVAVVRLNGSRYVQTYTARFLSVRNRCKADLYLALNPKAWLQHP